MASSSSFVVVLVVVVGIASSATIQERTTCKDTSSKCEQWATEGLCDQDPDMAHFMGRRCPFACDVCGSGKRVAERSACEDVDPGCEEMAIDGFCTDPDHQTFMEKACPYACDVCSTRKRGRARAMAHLMKLSKRADQEAPEKRTCRDLSPKCERYALDGLCSDLETSSLMSKSCPYACDGCKRKRETSSRARRHVIELVDLAAHAPDPEKRACRDFSPKCEQYAVDGLCGDSETSTLMARTCPYACDGCKRKRTIEDLTEALNAAPEVEARACRDLSPKCELYAVDGLCRDSETSGLMARTCPFACDGCKKKRAVEELKEVDEEVGDLEARSCRDLSPKCEAYATDGLCGDSETSSLMARTCPYACDGCKRKRAVEELTGADDANNVEAAQRSCRDLSPKCEQYATDGLCRDAETSGLLSRTCPFACDVNGCRRKRAIDDLTETANSNRVDARSCRDFSPKCEQYAVDGLCMDLETSSLMSRTCPFACDSNGCKRKRAIEDLTESANSVNVETRSCRDLSPKCEQYAVDGLCMELETSSLMSRTCPFACDSNGCKRKRAIEDLTESGNSVNEESRSCRDLSPKCEQYAVDGLCGESETSGLMARTCPFACDFNGCKREVNLRRKRAIVHLSDSAKTNDVDARTCRDTSPMCEQYATDGLCGDTTAAGLIAKTCPFACDFNGCKREVLDRKRRAVDELIEASNEVPEDAEKRSCRDYSAKCEVYATDGLCSDAETSGLMSRTCPFACDGCKREVRARGTCKDKNSKCEMWATDGMCRQDPDMVHFMGKTCPFACDVC